MEPAFAADIGAVGQIEAVPKILEVVCRITGMGFAAVARVTEDRWICCAVKDDISFGLRPGGELKVETTICNEIRQHGSAVIIDDVATDGAYCGHPTPQMYGFKSYISIPIQVADGAFWGTLCAIDPHPRSLNTPEIVETFRLFAELIAIHLDTMQRYEQGQENLRTSEALLLDERRTAELREQFIAVLGHDLRNPLASIQAGARLLQRSGLDAQADEVLQLMRNSTTRMGALIDNILDFARGRLGGGVLIQRDASEPLLPALEQVVKELQAVSPANTIVTRFNLTTPVNCDRDRIARLLSNLLGNAIAYGAADQPIVVEAKTDGGQVELSVTNAGEAIPAGAVDRLFHPFERGTVNAGQQGLGLGLYIASQIARAHGGALSVTSSPKETRFTFRMPL